MRYLHYLFFISIIGIFLGIAWFDYEVFWPVRTLEIHNLNTDGVIDVQVPTVSTGAAVGYVLDYCKFTSVKASVTRSLVDGQIIKLANSTGYLPIGCHKTLLLTSVIPETINPGRYYLDINVSYKLNLFRTENVHYRTTYFTVVKSKK